MHGADRDIVWLQRDFGIYVCNLFDTGQVCLSFWILFFFFFLLKRSYLLYFLCIGIAPALIEIELFIEKKRKSVGKYLILPLLNLSVHLPSRS
jgi:hypothetical protein